MPEKSSSHSRKAVGAVVVCTGFHRSATSLTAQMLHAAGLDMGRRLVSAHVSNPDGHFEDIDMVNINDRLLLDAGTDWRFHDETSLPKPEAAVSAVQAYIEIRDRDHGRRGWGVKDPRISLFLPAWERVLGSRGRFILVIRHWGGSVQSLLNRHSRVLVEQGKGAGINPEDEHLSFWVRPGLAARMWVAYSRRILAFAQHMRGAALILPQPALMNGFDLISWMNSNWGTKLKSPPAGIIKHELLTDRVDLAVADMVTPILRSQMENIWQQLLALGCSQLGLNAEDEIFEPIWSNSESDELLDAVVVRVQRLSIQKTVVPVEEPPSDEPRPITAWTKDEVRELLKRRSVLPPSLMAHIFTWLESNVGEDPDIWQEYGVRALKDGAVDLADKAFMRAAATGRAGPSLWLHIGQMYERKREYERAEYHYREAIRRNGKNAFFVVTLAKLLVMLYRNEEALSLLEKSIEASGHPALVVLWVQLMTELRRHDEAIQRVELLREQFPEHDSEWRRQRAILELPLNAAVARTSLNDVIRHGLKIDDVPSILTQVLVHIDANVAFYDLAARMLTHWREVFSTEDLQRALIGDKR